MARKLAAEIKAAAQVLAPVRPAEPEIPWGERKSAYEAARARMAKARLAHPKPRPLDHWKRVLSDPYVCGTAKQMAEEAIAELERRTSTEDRIAIDAEIQETARRIVKQMGGEEH